MSDVRLHGVLMICVSNRPTSLVEAAHFPGLWLCEMTRADIRELGETGSTIDKIEVADFETLASLKEWLKAKAPASAQRTGVVR